MSESIGRSEATKSGANATKPTPAASKPAGMLGRSVAIVAAFLPFAQRHRGTFLWGCIAACAVVVGRLALPWPFRAVADRWVPDPAGDASQLVGLTPDHTTYVLAMGVLFLLIILVLGLADFAERVFFARFSIGTVRDLRTKAFWSAVRSHAREEIPPSALAALAAADQKNAAEDGDDEEEERHSTGSGDLVARLVGDTARVKNGLQGFLVHVMTNGTVFLGVAIILLFMDRYLGLVFAAAGAGTMLVTIWAAARIFQRTLKHRKKEGELAEQIQDAFRGNPSDARFVEINKSSGNYEATQTQIQGIATCSAHVFFGAAVLAALWIGSLAVDAGRITVGDMVVMMMYALLMRGPIVRLARQGSKTGKILGAAHRVLQMLEREPAAGQEAASFSATPLRECLRLSNVTVQCAVNGLKAGAVRPVSLEIRAGEHLAIVGQVGAGKTTLLEVISGRRQIDQGALHWDDLDISGLSVKVRKRRIRYVPHSGDRRAAAEPAEAWFGPYVRLIHRDASLWLFDEPTRNLSAAAGAALIKALLDTKGASTVVVATDRPSDIEAFDRVLHLQDGRVVFNGSPEKWRRCALARADFPAAGQGCVIAFGRTAELAGRAGSATKKGRSIG